MKRNAFILPVLSLFLLLCLPPSLPAQQNVKIGVIYPMSGPIAQAGLDNRHAIELALEIINTTKHKDLNLPLAKTAGLPNLGGAKLSVVFADHQGKPDLGLSEAERLLTQEKVVALCGCYNSNVTETASMVAERLKMPFFNPESSSPRLTRRGFKWFFRSTPHDETFSQAMFQCLVDLEKKRGTKFKTIAVAYEDSLYGKDSSRIEKDLAQKAGYTVVADIPYRRSATSLTSEVQKLKAANPDVLFPTSYASDAILLLKTSKDLDYNPAAIMAQNSGHTDPSFIEAVGKDADGIASRSEFSLDLAAKRPLVKEVNDLFKQRSGRDFSGTCARAFVGFMVLADAINRAGSTQPEAIREALIKTNIPADQLITPWRGVKFDETGQNILGDAIVIQWQGGKSYTVWPFNLATKDLIYPIPKWSARK
jgi:branched-chain amino acid transport system substrate-binding protein